MQKSLFLSLAHSWVNRGVRLKINYKHITIVFGIIVAIAIALTLWMKYPADPNRSSAARSVSSISLTNAG